jgi:predicted RNase H-like HicB family nuclease
MATRPFDGLRENLQEVLALCLAELGDEAQGLPRFVGVQQIDIGV